VREGLERLHAAHALVLDQVTREVRMALPFSNVPTPYRLESHGRSWNANCAWDAIALARLLDLRRAVLVDAGGAGRPGRALGVADGRPVERDGVISLPRPAWRWWDDIVFT
jgi:Alkylmercury lyase